MTRTYIKELKNKIGQEVIVKGFVEAIRDQGGIKFLVLRDVSEKIQVVILKSEKEAFDFVSEISLESVIKIKGLVKEEKQAPNGFELQALEIEMLSKAQPELPIPVIEEKSGDETDITKRFDWRFIDLRKTEKLQIFKVWTALEKGFRKYFDENNFIQVNTPAFMSTASESGAEVFEVNYFDRKAYLAQSPQFYKQMAMAAGLEKVCAFGPVFRAEPSFTTRHLTEFTGWDFEMSFIESHEDVMRELEALIISGFGEVKKILSDLEIPNQPFPRISIKDAKEKLKEFKIPSEKDYDLNSQEEIKLGELIKEETGSDFVFLVDYPIEGRPFYHMRYEENQNLTKSFDLIYKGIEIVTGAQREHRVEVLEKQAKEKNMDLESLKDYIDFFRYGCPPHGGVGIGPARIIMKMLELSSVKEATFLPRDVKRLTP